jgi:type IV secretory pathway TrbD component
VTNPALEAAGPQTEKFATSAGRYLGFIVVGVAVVLIVLGVQSQGTGAFGLIGFCVAFSLLTWVALIRPQVAAHKNGLVLRNMLRDTFVPWASIKSCRVAQTLQVGTRDRVYHGLGVTKSARQANREQRRQSSGRTGRRTVFGPNFGMGSMASAPEINLGSDDVSAANRASQQHEGGSYFSHTERRIETLAQERATSTAGAEPKIVWDPIAIGALVLAALCVVLAVVS